MALDVNLVKERLKKIQQKANGQTYEKIDYDKIFFKPKVGEQTVRIVPAIWNKDYPIKNVTFHNYDLFKKNVYVLTNWGEKDPIVEFRKSLFNAKGDRKQDMEDLAKKLRPQEKYFVPVVVRGEEGRGVLLWQFGSNMEKDLLSLFEKADKIGDITDIMQGRDLELTGITKAMNNNKAKTYVEVNIMPSFTTSPLSEDSKLIEKWLSEQKDPIQIYKKRDFEEIKSMFMKWYDPEAAEAAEAQASTNDEVEEATDDEEVPFVPDPPKAEVKKEILPKTTVKSGGNGKSAAQLFEEAFGK